MQLGSKARKTGCSAKQETQAHYPRLGAGRWPRIEMKREPSVYSSIHPAGGVALSLSLSLSCPLVVRSDHCRALCLSGCLEKSRSLRRSLLNELAMAKIGSGVGFNCPLAAVSIFVAPRAQLFLRLSRPCRCEAGVKHLRALNQRRRPASGRTQRNLRPRARD